MMEFFESLGVDMEISDMSFSVSLDKGQGCEWGSRNDFSSLFAQKKNLLNPYFCQMLREILKFKNDVFSYLEELENNPEIDRNETLGQFIKSRGYSELFQKAYLIPICGSIWSCPSGGVMSFSAFSVLSFCRKHHLLQLFGRPQWLTVRRRSHSYVNKVRELLESWGCQIKTGWEVCSVLQADEGHIEVRGDGLQGFYDGCTMAVHAPDALRILGNQATFDERRVLGAFQYIYRTYTRAYLVQIVNWPVPSVAASKASLELDCIQGKRGIWFCGAYQGYGFHEDGLKAGMVAAHGVLGKSCTILSNPRHMISSLMETGARLFVARFLRQYISTGCLILLEEGGTIFTFEGTQKNCLLKTVLKIHSPQFYWKVMTQAAIGLADSYINGEFSFVDKDEGLLNLFMILIANRDLDSSVSIVYQKRGWWSPLFFTAGIASAKYFLRHIARHNSLTQARRNISCHYDLSKDEDLNVAQMRKFSLLIEKARVSKGHELLEIGCVWGALDVKVVKQNGCKYTGITLSEEQLKYAEMKAREAGLQDDIKLYLCDYRQLPKTYKYDRIISCEMIEAVGHEYMEEFFGCCESLLEEDGLLVLQSTTLPDYRYNEYRLNTDFIKEYIFPGGCLPSVSRITSAMAAASRLCVEHWRILESITTQHLDVGERI